MSFEYRNDYPAAQPKAGLNPRAQYMVPLKQYDLHFAAGRVRAMYSDKVWLVPLVPSLYASALETLFTRHPGVNQYRRLQTKTLDDVLVECENRRANPNACLWGVFSIEPSTALDDLPSSDKLVGAIGLHHYNPLNLSVEIGPLIIFPPFEELNLATHAVILMQTFVFEELGLAKIVGKSQFDNAACNKVGVKLRFHHDTTTRCSIGHCNGSSFSSKTRIIDEDDPRALMMFTESAIASVTWSEWNRDTKALVEIYRCQVRCPSRFKNSLETVFSLPNLQRETHLHTPPRDYDHNYAGEVVVVNGVELCLVPFVPKLHGTTLFDLLQHADPSALESMKVDGATRGESISLSDLTRFLLYLDGKRKDSNSSTWVVCDKKDRQIVFGFVVLRGDDRYPSCKTSAIVGPLVVVDPDKKGIARIVLALILKYAFTSSHIFGRGCTRVSGIADPCSPSAALFKELGFRQEGVARYPLGAPLTVAHVPSMKTPKARRMWNLERREAFNMVSFWVGSVTWPDWFDEVKEMSHKLLAEPAE